MSAELGAASARAGPDDRERGELIRGLYRNIPVVVVCMLLGAIATCAGMVYLAPERTLQIAMWLGLSGAVAVWQLGLWAWCRFKGMADADWRTWARRLTLASFADGVRWGSAPLWLAASSHADQMMWACMVSGGAACASVAALGSYVPAYYALLFPTIVPFLVRATTLDDPRYWGVAVLGSVVLLGMAWLGRLQARTLSGALRLRFENLDLAEDLRRQRDVAEQANLAKANFLASASHDLRQPMHALGMFVAALGRGRLGVDEHRLLRQVEETVEAMDGLFESLLDISQLDAGVTRPAPRAFPIQPLLARICREEAAGIGDHPIRLRAVPCGATVVSDPILLERMLRNLIANAVRHTREGRILVGCRRRNGRLSIEVWDTGPGIPPEHQTRVFEEFVQLANPERNRANGLGLGLAITRRLAELLGCPVDLRSWPGQGSVFSVSAPLGLAGAVDEDSDVATIPAQAGLVFVVDDESLVRESTSRLLETWGYRTAVGGSADEVLACANGATPDLVVCDWRLRGGETASTAIAQIRRSCGADSPVLIISGDIAPQQLRAIHETGFALLHKPVPPARLRAAVGNLIRSGAEDAALSEEV